MDESKEKMQGNVIKKEILENMPTSNDQKIKDPKTTYSEILEPTQKLNILLKALQEFSSKYDTDSLNILEGQKYLLSFGQIISLIKDIIKYQKTIIETDISEKDKIQEVSQDFINKLNFTIFSYEKVDILKNESIEKNKNNNRKNRNQILYSKKISKTQTRFSLSNSNIIVGNNKEDTGTKINKNMKKFFSTNYSKEKQNIKIKRKKNDNQKIKGKNILKKEIKCYNSNIKPLKNNKIYNTNNNENNLKTPYKPKIKELKNQLEEYKKTKKEEINNKPNDNKKLNIDTKIYRTNIKRNINNPLTTRNSNSKEFNSFSSQLDSALKNNSVILRSSSLKNKNSKEVKFNIMDAYNFYSTFNDLEKKLLNSKTVKEGYIIKGKINILSKVPKPSILANKLLESSKKYINDYNGVNEEEKKKNNYLNRSHSKNKKKK